MGAGFTGLAGPCGLGVTSVRARPLLLDLSPLRPSQSPHCVGRARCRSPDVAAKGLGLNPKSPPAGDRPQVLPGNVGRGPSATRDGSWISVPKALENPGQFLLRGAMTSLWTPCLPRV